MEPGTISLLISPILIGHHTSLTMLLTRKISIWHPIMGVPTGKRMGLIIKEIRDLPIKLVASILLKWWKEKYLHIWWAVSTVERREAKKTRPLKKIKEFIKVLDPEIMKIQLSRKSMTFMLLGILMNPSANPQSKYPRRSHLTLSHSWKDKIITKIRR